LFTFSNLYVQTLQLKNLPLHFEQQFTERIGLFPVFDLHTDRALGLNDPTRPGSCLQLPGRIPSSKQVEQTLRLPDCRRQQTC